MQCCCGLWLLYWSIRKSFLFHDVYLKLTACANCCFCCPYPVLVGVWFASDVICFGPIASSDTMMKGAAPDIVGLAPDRRAHGQTNRAPRSWRTSQHSQTGSSWWPPQSSRCRRYLTACTHPPASPSQAGTESRDMARTPPVRRRPPNACRPP